MDGCSGQGVDCDLPKKVGTDIYTGEPATLILARLRGSKPLVRAAGSFELQSGLCLD